MDYVSESAPGSFGDRQVVLHFFKAGSAGDCPAVLLLHGLMGSPGNFERTARGLLELGIPLAAPLYGLRGTVPLERSFGELADVAGDILATRERIDIVGHSLGGHLGLRLAHEFPGGVRTLVGVGAAFRGLPLPPNPVVRRGVGLVMGRGADDLMTAVPFAAAVPAGCSS